MPRESSPADDTRNTGREKRNKDPRKRLSWWWLWVILSLRRKPVIYSVLDAERKPLRVAVFGATSIVTDNKTVTVCQESLDGSVKKRVVLWKISKICEMTAVDWSPNAEKLDHLCDLEIRKPVERGEVDLLIGSDYYEVLLLPLEHRIGNPGEPVAVKTPPSSWRQCWVLHWQGRCQSCYRHPFRTVHYGQTARTSFSGSRVNRGGIRLVANRVSESHQKSSPRQWRHVPTDLNCADDANRGLHAKVLTSEHRWFSGPRFLHENEDYWPQGKCVGHEKRSHECLTEIVKPKMTSALEVS